MGIAPLKAVLAIVFLLMSAFQPGLFATANATGFHGDTGMTLSIDEPAQDASGHVHGRHDKADASQSSSKPHHDGGKNSGDKSCEVHCAPAQAVPVDCPVFGHARASCFEVLSAAVLPLGEYAELIRPPRHLN